MIVVKLGMFLLVCAATYVFVDYEYLRYRLCLDSCKEKQVRDADLTRSSICTDAQLRLQYKLAGTVNCDLAEARLRLSVHECARREWLATSELARLWNTMTESYWHILPFVGFSVVLVGYLFYLVASSIMEDRRDKRFFQQQSKFMDQLRHSSNNSSSLNNGQVLLLKNRKRKRTKRKNNATSWEEVLA